MKLRELPQLFTVNSVSEKYEIPQKEIYGLVRDNQISHYRIGPRMIRFDINQIEQMVKLLKERKRL